ncbi:MAG: manganese efflux pump MntP family protein [Vulcanimicrobiaceae bacterium]
MWHVAWRVALIAFSLALDVFAVAVAIGIRGAPLGAKVRLSLAFAGAEVLMNLVGAGIGALLGKLFGEIAAYIGFAALAATGIYVILETMRGGEERRLDLSRGWGLAVGALSLSVDSLGVGFSILYIGAPLALTLAAIAAASLVSTTLGFALGRFVGSAVGGRAGILAGIVMVATGIAFAYFRAAGVP